MLWHANESSCCAELPDYASCVHEGWVSIYKSSCFYRELLVVWRRLYTAFLFAADLRGNQGKKFPRRCCDRWCYDIRLLNVFGSPWLAQILGVQVVVSSGINWLRTPRCLCPWISVLTGTESLRLTHQSRNTTMQYLTLCFFPSQRLFAGMEWMRRRHRQRAWEDRKYHSCLQLNISGVPQRFPSRMDEKPRYPHSNSLVCRTDLLANRVESL